MNLIIKKLFSLVIHFFLEKEKIIYFVEIAISNFIPLNYHIAAEKIIVMNLGTLQGISYNPNIKG